MSNDRLRIWNAVRTPDPAFTKQFSRSGGFRGTATSATYLVRMATEVFGVVGIGWGYEIVDERIIDGVPPERVHVIRLRLWFLDPEFGERGQVEHFGQTLLVGTNKYGPYTDEEAPKKSLTDALTKCLSMLGFAADIHMGLFDDNKYVEDARAKKAPPTESKRPSKEESLALMRRFKQRCDEASSIDDLDELVKRATPDLKAMLKPAGVAMLLDYRTFAQERMSGIESSDAVQQSVKKVLALLREGGEL